MFSLVSNWPSASSTLIMFGKEQVQEPDGMRGRYLQLLPAPRYELGNAAHRCCLAKRRETCRTKDMSWHVFARTRALNACRDAKAFAWPRGSSWSLSLGSGSLDFRTWSLRSIVFLGI